MQSKTFPLNKIINNGYFLAITGSIFYCLSYWIFTINLIKDYQHFSVVFFLVLFFSLIVLTIINKKIVTNNWKIAAIMAALAGLTLPDFKPLLDIYGYAHSYNAFLRLVFPVFMFFFGMRDLIYHK